MPLRSKRQNSGADVADDQPVLLVQRHAVRSGAAAGHLDVGPDLGGGAIGLQRDAPHRVLPRDGDEQAVLREVQHQAVRARRVVNEAIEPAAIRREAKHAARPVVHAGLALVGEIAVAVAREHEIVEALEALAVAGREDRFDRAARRVQHQEPALVVADEDAPVAVDLQPVGPAVVLGDQVALACGRQPEHPAERNVDEIQVAGAVERRSFEEAVHRLIEPIGVRPRGAPLVAILVRQPEDDFGLEPLGWFGNKHGRFPPGVVRRQRSGDSIGSFIPIAHGGHTGSSVTPRIGDSLAWGTL